MKFTKQEYTDFHFYSMAKHVVTQERFPERDLPFRCTFVELHLHLCEAGFDWFQYNGVLDPRFNRF
jgi:hypothetical protein